MESDIYTFEEFYEDCSAFSVAQIDAAIDPAIMAEPHFLSVYKTPERARKRILYFWRARSFLQRCHVQVGCVRHEFGYRMKPEILSAVWAVYTTIPLDEDLSDEDGVAQVLDLISGEPPPSEPRIGES